MGEARQDLGEAAASLRPPSWVGEQIERHGQGAENFGGAMPRVPPRRFEVGAQFFSQRVLPEQQDQQVGQGESHQETQEALGLLHLEVQAAQPQVTLPVSKALRNLHALTIQGHYLGGGEPSFRVGRHNQKPGLLKSLLAVDDDIDGFGRAAVVEDVTIAEGLAGAMRQAAQADALPTTPHRRLNDPLTPGSDQEGLSAAIPILDQGPTGIAAIKNQNQPHPGRRGFRQPS